MYGLQTLSTPVNKSEVIADIISVHGVHDAGSDSLKSADDVAYGLLVKNFTSKLPKARVSIYRYSVAGENINIFLRRGLSGEALRLLGAIGKLQGESSAVSFRTLQPTLEVSGAVLNTQQKPPLIFLGKDVGGTIIKEALVRASSSHYNFRDIYSSTHAVIFLGCSHRCRNIASLKKGFARLFKYGDRAPLQLPPKLLSSLARATVAINEDFLETKLLFRIRVVNLFSTHKDLEQRIFDQYEATMMTQNSYRHVQVASDLSHAEMTQWSLPDTAFKLIKPIAEDDFQTQNVQSLFTPHAYFPLPAIHSQERTGQEEAILIDTAFLNWKFSVGTSFLVLHDWPNATETAWSIYNHLSDEKSAAGLDSSFEFIFPFEFRTWDCRCNSVESLFCSFLVAFLSNVALREEQILNDFPQTADKYHGWNLEDLVLLLYCILLSSDRAIVWVLSNLDEHIEHYQWLLEKLSSLAMGSEFKFKVLLVRQGQSGVELDAAHFTSLKFGGTRHGISPVAMRLNQNPIGEPCFINDSVEPAIEDSDHGEGLGESSLNKFTTSSNGGPLLATDIPERILGPYYCRSEEQILDLSSTSLKKEFRLLLGLALDNSSSRQSVSNSLELMFYSLRPFSIHELLDLEVYTLCLQALDVGPDQISYGQIAPIPLLPDLLSVLGNEVHFCHPHFREFLVSQRAGEDLDFSDHRRATQAHSRIASLCVTYLCSQHGQDLMRHRILQGGTLESGDSEARLTFLSYALTYWPEHVRLAGMEFAQSSELIRSLMQDDVIDLWVKSYWSLLNPMTRVEAECISPISTIAEHGSENLLDAVLDGRKSLPSFSAECSHALVGVARRGDICSVQKYLSNVPIPEGQKFDEAIIVALTSGNVQTAQELVEVASKRPDRLVNPSRVLNRALSLNLRDIVKLLIPLAVAQKPTSSQGAEFLLHASLGGSLEDYETLLEYATVLQISSTEEGMVAHYRGNLGYACRFGHHLLAAFLARKILTPATNHDDNDDNDGTTEAGVNPPGDFLHALEIATSSGQHKTLASLLDVLPKRWLRNAGFLGQALVCAVLKGNPMCCKVLRSFFSRVTESGGSISELNDLFEDAAKRGNVAILRQLLDVGCRFNSEAFEGILDLAIRNGDAALDSVKILVKEARGICTLEAHSAAISVALGKAIVSTRAQKLAIFLIDEGADVEVGTSTQSPLFSASLNGCENVVERLIKAKANVNATTKWIPLIAAHGNAKIIRLLLEAGANINAEHGDGRTTLFLAVQYDCQDSVAELLKHKPKMDILIGHETELSHALRRRNTATFGMLLDAGADPLRYCSGELDLPLLHYCVRENLLDALKRLLLYSIDVGQTDKRGEAALSSISLRTTAEVVNLLARRGASIHQIWGGKRSPLFRAVSIGNVEVARLLISLGAHPDSWVDGLGSLLLIACRQSSAEMVKLLLDNGADVNDANKESDETPFQAACHRGQSPENLMVVNCILDANGLDVDQSSVLWGCNLNVACTMADLSVVRSLIQRGARVMVKDQIGRRPIHFALYRTVDHVKYLSDQVKIQSEETTDIYGQDLMQRNALHFAVASGRLDVVQYILKDHKHLANEVDIDGWTPLLWALRVYRGWDTPTTERVSIIKELLENYNASRLIKGEGIERKWTAYKLAQYYGLGEEVIDLVTPSKKELESLRPEDRKWWKLSFDGEENKGRELEGDQCSACMMTQFGVYWICAQCPEYNICFKCYRSRNIIHDPKHNLILYDEDESGLDSDTDDMENYLHS